MHTTSASLPRRIATSLPAGRLLVPPAPFTDAETRALRSAYESDTLEPAKVAPPMPASVAKEVADKGSFYRKDSTAQAVRVGARTYWLVTTTWKSNGSVTHELYSAKGTKKLEGGVTEPGKRYTLATKAEQAAGDRVLQALRANFQSQRYDFNFTPKRAGLEVPPSSLPTLQRDIFGREPGAKDRAYRFGVDGRAYYLVLANDGVRPTVYDAAGTPVINHVYTAMQVRAERFRD